MISYCVIKINFFHFFSIEVMCRLSGLCFRNKVKLCIVKQQLKKKNMKKKDSRIICYKIVFTHTAVFRFQCFP